MLLDWARLARWRDWAQSKLPFTAAVAVLLASEASPAVRMIEIVATIVAGAAFGYALNDVADRAYDARSGKPNRAADVSPTRWGVFLALTAGGAFGLSLLWAPDAAAPVLILVALTSSVAYSVPPLRLKERGALALIGAAAAQWLLPVLVVSAAEPQGWLRPAAWSFALLGLALGTRWIMVHQLADASVDRRAGIRSYAAGRADVQKLLVGVFACELVLLVGALALTWPRSLPAAAALALWVLATLLSRSWRWPLGLRVARYEAAPLAGYYFFAFPVAAALSRPLGSSDSAVIAAVLVILVVPHVIGRVGRWRRDRAVEGRQVQGPDRAIRSRKVASSPSRRAP
jgi:4-hydroxybenzoate polyprenyltransferase